MRRLINRPPEADERNRRGSSWLLTVPYFPDDGFRSIKHASYIPCESDKPLISNTYTAARAADIAECVAAVAEKCSTVHSRECGYFIAQLSLFRNFDSCEIRAPSDAIRRDARNVRALNKKWTWHFHFRMPIDVEPSLPAEEGAYIHKAQIGCLSALEMTCRIELESQ